MSEDNHQPDNDSHPSKPTSSQLHKIAEGFKILQMKMKNAQNGQTLWTCESVDLQSTEEQSFTFPK